MGDLQAGDGSGILVNSERKLSPMPPQWGMEPQKIRDHENTKEGKNERRKEERERKERERNRKREIRR
jgi:hypothetical protein